MACEMETVLPSFVLVMAMPILGWPLVRVIEVEGASVCSTVAISPSVMGVGLTVGVCVAVGSGEALLPVTNHDHWNAQWPITSTRLSRRPLSSCAAGWRHLISFLRWIFELSLQSACVLGAQSNARRKGLINTDCQ